MELYNHFKYGEQLATRLKSIAHTPERPRYFTAYGLEDLFNFEDKISTLTGFVLIAVNGYESDSSDNHSDGLTDTLQYAFIVARNTISDRTGTIQTAFEESRKICKQIRNALLLDERLQGFINRNTQLNGIGPIGDNFYGCLFSFSIQQPEDYFLDESYWNDGIL